jgi:hypothetical protein
MASHELARPLPRAMPADRSNQWIAQARSSSTTAADFFETTYGYFREAVERASSVERNFRVGGYDVRMCFAGLALVPRIAPAFEHLSTESGAAPDLTVCLWDSASTRTADVTPAWTTEAYAAQGKVTGYCDDRFLTAYDMGTGVLSLLDTQRSIALYWTRDGHALPSYESGAPLRTILNWWMRGHGRHLAHAAAVGGPDGGILLAGKGGMGKSTTAMACLDSSLLYAGDDYVLLSAVDRPKIYSIYNSAKVGADAVHRLPHLASAIGNYQALGAEKAIFFLQDRLPHKLAGSFALRAILLPRVTGQPHTKLRPASSAEGLLALAPSSMFQLPGAGPDSFQILAQVARQVPCYVLQLGTDLIMIPSVIEGLLVDLRE